MTISKEVIHNIETNLRKPLSEELKHYLFSKYSDEPFPYEYSEQDLYSNIERDIHAYLLGDLDTTTEDSLGHLQQEYEDLKLLYIEKCQKVRNLELYALELEKLLSKNNIESNKMKNDRAELLTI